MKSNAKLCIMTIVLGSLFIGLFSYIQVQSSSAQSTGLSALKNIPGYSMFEETLNDKAGSSIAAIGTPDYRIIDKAVIAKSSNNVQAVLQAHGHIPTNGEGGAFGYGILTTQGLNAIMVSTTHKGVYDSEDQRNANDPRWHNHYVKLVEDSNCKDGLKVESITFQSPGEVVVNKNKAVMSNLPAKFTGTSPPADVHRVTLNPGTNVQNVVSFTLKPTGNLVCVTNINFVDRDDIIKN
jgi:hypothetical protein